jgi:DNA-binding PadR family transcriptional regulator
MAGETGAKSTWMRGPSAPLRGALLGLLLERSGHGGDLANRLSVRLGQTWRVDTNDVYRLLEQLERAGLAVSRTEPKRGNHERTHLVYHPTEAAPTELAQWIETLAPREPVRISLHAKLSVAREQDAQRMLAALSAYEHECESLIGLIPTGNGADHSWLTLCVDSARESMTSQLQGEARWASRTRGRIEAFVKRRA